MSNNQTACTAVTLMVVLVALHVAGEEVASVLRYDRDASRWYSFFTASFVHFDYQHLLLNLVIFGSVIKLFESELDGTILWFIVVICGYASVCAEHIMGKPPFMLEVIDQTYGLSGACYGLIMYCAASKAFRGELSGAVLCALLVCKVSIEAIIQGPLFYSSVDTPAVFGHLGGALSGALLAIIVRRLLPFATSKVGL